MRENFFKRISSWTGILMMAVITTAFIIPALPAEWGYYPLRIGFTLIFFSGLFSLEKREEKIISFAVVALILEWVSDIFNFELLNYFSKLINIVFFFIVAVNLIRQVALARDVTVKVILESIICYILLGIIFSIFVAAIMTRDPGAFSNVTAASQVLGDLNRHASESIYYVFVTMGTLGYGDILPLKPYTRSLATFICIVGQLYIAIVIALLVGKYASDQVEKK